MLRYFLSAFVPFMLVCLPMGAQAATYQEAMAQAQAAAKQAYDQALPKGSVHSSADIKAASQAASAVVLNAHDVWIKANPAGGKTLTLSDWMAAEQARVTAQGQTVLDSDEIAAMNHNAFANYAQNHPVDASVVNDTGQSYEAYMQAVAEMANQREQYNMALGDTGAIIDKDEAAAMKKELEATLQQAHDKWQQENPGKQQGGKFDLDGFYEQLSGKDAGMVPFSVSSAQLFADGQGQTPSSSAFFEEMIAQYTAGDPDTWNPTQEAIDETVWELANHILDNPYMTQEEINELLQYAKDSNISEEAIKEMQALIAETAEEAKGNDFDEVMAYVADNPFISKKEIDDILQQAKDANFSPDELASLQNGIDNAVSSALEGYVSENPFMSQEEIDEVLQQATNVGGFSPSVLQEFRDSIEQGAELAKFEAVDEYLMYVSDHPFVSSDELEAIMDNARRMNFSEDEMAQLKELIAAESAWGISGYLAENPDMSQDAKDAMLAHVNNAGFLGEGFAEDLQAAMDGYANGPGAGNAAEAWAGLFTGFSLGSSSLWDAASFNPDTNPASGSFAGGAAGGSPAGPKCETYCAVEVNGFCTQYAQACY